jgi:hypothetical protein
VVAAGAVAAGAAATLAVGERDLRELFCAEMSARIWPVCSRSGVWLWLEAATPWRREGKVCVVTAP